MRDVSGTPPAITYKWMCVGRAGQFGCVDKDSIMGYVDPRFGLQLKGRASQNVHFIA